MDKNIIKDRIRGSFIGGAVGDALGYPVEFIYSFGDIQRRYGRMVLHDSIPINGGWKKTTAMVRL